MILEEAQGGASGRPQGQPRIASGEPQGVFLRASGFGERRYAGWAWVGWDCLGMESLDWVMVKSQWSGKALRSARRFRYDTFRFVTYDTIRLVS